jgi:hypothetical protein
MTDVIVESREGRRIHHFIPDNHPAIVYVKEDGTFRVKAADLTPEQQALRVIMQHK